MDNYKRLIRRFIELYIALFLMVAAIIGAVTAFSVFLQLVQGQAIDSQYLLTQLKILVLLPLSLSVTLIVLSQAFSLLLKLGGDRNKP